MLREVAVGRPVWESRRLLDGFVSESPLDAFVRDRAGESLAHVFTLLSLVLPREPLQIAFRGLHTDDRAAAGHGAGVPGRRAAGGRSGSGCGRSSNAVRRPHRARPREEVIAELLRSNHSIMLNLEELRRRTR